MEWCNITESLKIRKVETPEKLNDIMQKKILFFLYFDKTIKCKISSLDWKTFADEGDE